MPMLNVDDKISFTIILGTPQLGMGILSHFYPDLCKFKIFDSNYITYAGR